MCIAVEVSQHEQFDCHAFHETHACCVIAVRGIFVEIGLIPATMTVECLVELNKHKQISIDPWTQRTSVEGIWAAGDCTNVRYHQNNIAAGDAVRALEDIYVYLKAS